MRSCAMINETPGMFKRVRQSMLKRMDEAMDIAVVDSHLYTAGSKYLLTSFQK